MKKNPYFVQQNWRSFSGKMIVIDALLWKAHRYGVILQQIL